MQGIVGAWNLILREEIKLRIRAFEEWAVRRIFGSKRDDITGEWTELHKK